LICAVFRHARLIGLTAVFTLTPFVVGSQQPTGIRGFRSAHVNVEREREQQIQALPVADNLRDYMRTIAAEPHHAGSAGSRRVADYVLGQFKSWGLSATI